MLRRASRALCSAAGGAPAPALAVYSWGGGSAGALGHGNENNVEAPTRLMDAALLAALASASASSRPRVSAGLFHSAVTVPGVGAWLFGRGAGGRLGAGDERDSHVPRRVSASTESGCDESGALAQAALGGLHTLLLSTSGTLFSCGFGGFGALGHGDFNARHAATPLRLPGGLRVAQAAAGGAHSLAVTTCGQLLSFGRDEGDGRLGLSASHGGGNSPALVPLPPGAAALHAAAGGFHSLLLTSMGGESVVLSVGGNANGECGRQGGTWALGRLDAAPSFQDVVQLCAGGFHSAALTREGRLFTWGGGQGGALGHGDKRSCRAPTLVQELPPVARLACGGASTFAACVDGSLWAWGKNVERLGHTSADVLAPRRVPLPPGVRALDVAAGAAHAVVLCTDEQGT